MSETTLQHRPCVIFVANRGFSLVSSRLPIIQYFLQIGWLVVTVTARDDYGEVLLKTGAICEEVAFNRGGISPLKDLAALLNLIKIYQKYKPSLIHHFHAKPILFGSLASSFVPDAKIVNTVTGLGHAFIHKGLTYVIASIGYKSLLSKSSMTIFQNSDDWKLFLEKGWINKEKSQIIMSSGVNIKRFHPNINTSEKKEIPRVLMVSRLLWQKGVREFVEAAEIIKQKNYAVNFELGGEWDLVHPNAVNQDWVKQAENQGIIKFIGYVKDMEKELCYTDIFVLPSYYREGFPRVLLEASACGVPIVTVDVPGCREAVVDGETGKLVPPRNSKALAQSIFELLMDNSLREKMGRAGRERIEREFDIKIITDKYLDLYRKIGLNLPILSTESNDE